MSFSSRFLFGSCFLLLVHPGMNRAIAEPRKLKGPKETIVALRFSPDGNLLASAAFGGRTRIWDVVTGQEKITLDGGNAATFSADGKTLAYVHGTEVHVLDLAKNAVIRRFKGHQKKVAALAFAPDGTLASAGYDKSIRLWSIVLDREIRRFDTKEGRITALAFSPDGKKLVSGGTTLVQFRGNNTISTGFADHVRVWDVTGKEEVRELPTRASQVGFSADGKTIAVAGLVPDLQQRRRGTSLDGLDWIATAPGASTRQRD